MDSMDSERLNGPQEIPDNVSESSSDTSDHYSTASSNFTDNDDELSPHDDTHALLDASPAVEFSSDQAQSSASSSSWDISYIAVSSQRIYETTGLDILLVCDMMVSALESKGEYKVLVSQKGQRAQSWLNLLRQLLDCSLNSRARSLFTQALTRLSKSTGLYPHTLFLSGLETGPHPVTAGSFGDVYKGILLGQPVSVKVIRIFQDPEAESMPPHAFYRESIVWSQLRHPNILPFYGTYYFDKHKSRLCLVSPWMENGNIVQFLKRFPGADRLLLALDIAQGIAYLHENNIVHGDLKGVNILVSPAGRACIADFGLSSISDTDILRWTSLATSSVRGGTARWQAPEVLKGSHNSRAADIYSFACVCYEMFAGQHPFPDLRIDSAVVYRVVVQDERPTRPPVPDLVDAFWQLMEDCWKTGPDERPSANSAVSRLKDLPELRNIDIAASDWDESFPRILQSSLRDESLIQSLQELRFFFTDNRDASELPQQLMEASTTEDSESQIDREPTSLANPFEDFERVFDSPPHPELGAYAAQSVDEDLQFPPTRGPRLAPIVPTQPMLPVYQAPPLRVSFSTLPFSIQVHPLLNGGNRNNDLRFDLSSPIFAPQRWASQSTAEMFVLLSGQELAQPATHPPISTLRIICDIIPQWPIDLVPQRMHYVELHDVLLAIFRTLHKRIRHVDWAALNTGEEHAITRAFQKRCASCGSAELAAIARNDGVKRVDYLKQKIWFRGLVPSDGDVMKMVLG